MVVDDDVVGGDFPRSTRRAAEAAGDCRGGAHGGRRERWRERRSCGAGPGEEDVTGVIRPFEVVQGSGGPPAEKGGAGGGDPAGTSPEKAISRAERRRLIKEEIQKLAQGDKPLLYQRRLW